MLRQYSTSNQEKQNKRHLQPSRRTSAKLAVLHVVHRSNSLPSSCKRAKQTERTSATDSATPSSRAFSDITRSVQQGCSKNTSPTSFDDRAFCLCSEPIPKRLGRCTRRETQSLALGVYHRWPIKEVGRKRNNGPHPQCEGRFKT